MPGIKDSILSTLAYYDIFHYPLTQKELFLFLPVTCLPEELEAALEELVTNALVFEYEGYYLLTPNPQFLQDRREGYTRATALLKKAHQLATVLIQFPFIKGVAVSGSLSKYMAKPGSDIDFFIITTANRLWLARTLTHLLKKGSFLLKKQHFFCMNYYIDEAKLEIVEKNVFTATEIVTLMPSQGNEAFTRFYAANAWTLDYLPNHTGTNTFSGHKAGKYLFKALVEGLLNNTIGDYLDNSLMKITAGRWKQKTAKKALDEHGMVMSMDVNKHYSKPASKGFQSFFLEKLQKKISTVTQPVYTPARNTPFVIHSLDKLP